MSLTPHPTLLLLPPRLSIGKARGGDRRGKGARVASGRGGSSSASTGTCLLDGRVASPLPPSAREEDNSGGAKELERQRWLRALSGEGFSSSALSAATCLLRRRPLSPSLPTHLIIVWRPLEARTCAGPPWPGLAVTLPSRTPPTNAVMAPSTTTCHPTTVLNRSPPPMPLSWRDRKHQSRTTRWINQESKSSGIDEEGEQRQDGGTPAQPPPAARGGIRERGWGMGLRKWGRERGEGREIERVESVTGRSHVFYFLKNAYWTVM